MTSSPAAADAVLDAARRLREHGVSKLFTLSGGHLFSIYDGCRSEGIRLIDTRHEQTAAFAAEGWSKVTRVPGVVALTAGPGVTNGMSAMAAAQQNQSPMLVLGGRAPALRWGSGSLQEIDHVPFVAPLARYAVTTGSPGAVGDRVDEAWALGATEICMQGGIHPDFDGDYYVDVTRAVKNAVPDMHVHGFTALEVTEGAHRNGESLRDYLQRLKDAGLASLEAARQGTDHRALKSAVEALNRASESFAARRMDRSVRAALTGKKLDEVA